MKNDFDFIKERIENSGVNAPEHMDECYVYDRIAGVQPKAADASAQPELTQDQSKVKEMKPRRRYGKLTAIAACFVAAAVLTTALTVHFTTKRSVVDPAVSAVDPSTGLIRFSSYDEVHAALDKIDEVNRYRNSYSVAEDFEGYAVSDSAAAASGSNGSSKDASLGYSGTASGAESHSETYKQVEGVDEADIIKTDGRYIYAVENNYYWNDDDTYSCVCIFKAEPGSSEPILRIVPGMKTAKADEPATLPATADEATPDESDKIDDDDTMTYPVEPEFSDYTIVDEIFVKDGRLVILCEKYHTEQDEYYNGYGYGYTSYNTACAYVYDVRDMQNVRLTDTFTQSGGYISSRMIGDMPYLISNEYTTRTIPRCGRGDDPGMIPADCIYSIEKPSESTFLIVGAYDTADHSAVTESKAILGVGDEIYCSEDNLYISSTEWNYSIYLDYLDYEIGYTDDGDEYAVANDSPSAKSVDAADDDEDPDDSDEDEDEGIKTKIYKVSLTDGIAFTASGEVPGYVDNQYSFDEYNGYLRVATTSSNSNYDDDNNLYVLDGGMNIVGSVTGFAETEHIEAVRFMGDTAYVITYEQTDPLFIIDLSSPTAPAILGEVKISGFSTMLVPIDENTILGLGYHTGEYDYTEMEVQDGFKLALFDVSDKSSPKVLDSKSYVNYSSPVMYQPRALVYNPDRGDFVIPLNYYYANYSGSDDYEPDMHGDVLNFRIEGGRIVEIDHQMTDHSELDRCVYVGDTIYMTYTDNYGSGKVHLDSVSYR